MGDLVARALAEDLGALGDITSSALVPADVNGVGRFVVRADGVVAGTAAAAEVYRQLDDAVKLTWVRADGEAVRVGDELARVEGPLRSILTGERTALNLLCHLSGIATLTRRYVEEAGGRSRIRDTRKTLPGLRALEKAAVRAGGGFNHREGLSDAVLVKDNHLTLVGIERAVALARARWPARVVEVECDTLDQVLEAIGAGADLVLVDNMSPSEVAGVVAAVAGRVPIEVSGGVDLGNVAAYASTGVDFISVGALTHSAPALDIALDVEPTA